MLANPAQPFDFEQCVFPTTAIERGRPTLRVSPCVFRPLVLKEAVLVALQSHSIPVKITR